MKVLWLGQGGLLFVSGKTKIMIDPYLSDSLSKENHEFARRIKLNKKLFKVKPDVLIITNSHSDHADIETIEKLVKQRTKRRKLCVLSCESVFSELVNIPTVCQANHIMLEEYSEWTIDKVNIRAVPAKTDDKSAFGVIITDLENSRKYYVTGDTLYNEKVISNISNDIYATFLPINGEYGSMNVFDAKRFAGKINSLFFVPIHFGMFDKVNPKEFDLENAIIPHPYKIIDFEGSESQTYKKFLDAKFNERGYKEAENKTDKTPTIIYEEPIVNETEEQKPVIIENDISANEIIEEIVEIEENQSTSDDIPYNAVISDVTKVSNEEATEALEASESTESDKKLEDNVFDNKALDSDKTGNEPNLSIDKSEYDEEIPFEEGDWSEFLSDEIIEDEPSDEDDEEFEEFDNLDDLIDDEDELDDEDGFDDKNQSDADEDFVDSTDLNSEASEEKSYFHNDTSDDDADKIDAYIREIEKFERGETTDFSKID